MVKKCFGDPESILRVEGFFVEENLSYKEVSFEIIDTHVMRLRNNGIASVKVLWQNHQVEVIHWRPRTT